MNTVTAARTGDEDEIPYDWGRKDSEGDNMRIMALVAPVLLAVILSVVFGPPPEAELINVDLLTYAGNRENMEGFTSIRVMNLSRRTSMTGQG